MGGGGGKKRRVEGGVRGPNQGMENKTKQPQQNHHHTQLPKEKDLKITVNPFTFRPLKYIQPGTTDFCAPNFRADCGIT